MTTVVAVDVKLRGNTREEKKSCLGVFMSQFNGLLLERKSKRERGGKQKKRKMQAKHYEKSERKKKQGKKEAQSFRFAGGFGGKEKKVRKVRRGKGGVKEEKWNGKELQRKKRKSNARLITSAGKKRNSPFFSPLTL